MPRGIAKSGTNRGWKKRIYKLVLKICCCGKQFETSENLVAIGKGKFCSKSCMYANRSRRFGYKRVDKGINPSWFKPGHVSVATFPEGYRPANFKVEDFGYDTLHDWVRRHRGKPIKCEHCDSTANLQWANKSWEYKRELDDWLELCSRCHSKYDRDGDWGAGYDRFPERRKVK